MSEKNILIIGPPGSGKTYLAKNMAKGKKSLLISLHSGCTYENLIEGIEISTDTSEISYDLSNKAVLNFVHDRLKKNEIGYLIFDDINRIDFVSVAGELLYALANRNINVSLKSGNKMCIPENLVFIATMNSADMNYTSDYSVMGIFDKIIRTKNDLIEFEIALNSMIQSKISKDEDNKKYEDTKKKLIENYLKYMNDYCVFKKELDDYKEDFKIGYTYFLPNVNIDVSMWFENVQHKIRHQVLPLLWQYEKDGIIEKECIPIEEKLDTKFIKRQEEKSKIEFINEEEYLNLEKEVFVEGKPLPIGRRLKRNASLKISWQYIILSGILREMVEHPLINRHDLMEILVDDNEVAWFRNDVSKDGITGGKLLVEESMAKYFPTQDAARGNLGSYSYSENYHKIKYDNKLYRMFSAYQSTNKVKCPFNIEECKATGTSPQKQHIFRVVKMLVYKYFCKYRHNLTKLIDAGNADFTDILKLEQVNKDIEKIKNVTDDVTHKDEEYYVNLNDENGINIVNYIRNLPTWQMMLSEEGAYRTMSREYQRIMDITDIHQMILQGPPGTSKTYEMKKFLSDSIGINGDNWEIELGKYQLGKKEDYQVPIEGEKIYWDIVQFHPSYTYEDFVRGITVEPQKNGKIVGSISGNEEKKRSVELMTSGGITYNSVNKAMGKIAKLANDYYLKYKEEEKLDECPKFYLLIDEINRANLATVFGELIYALEYRDQPVKTPYVVEGDYDLVIPSNLYILGTMNTADKSIGTIDYAIRRRFLFFKMLPSIETVIKSVKQFDQTNAGDALEVRLFYLIEKLFDVAINSYDYEKEDVQIGHTYFLRVSDNIDKAKDQMKYRLIYQVAAILHEYKKDGVLDFSRIEYDAEEWQKGALIKLQEIIEEINGEYDILYDELLELLYNDDFSEKYSKDFSENLMKEVE